MGFGPRELATLEISDSAAIARQLAFEMNITASTELKKAIVDWIQNLRALAKMAARLEGILASDIEWERLAVRRRFGPTMAPEKAPPPADKLRKLELTGCLIFVDKAATERALCKRCTCTAEARG